MDQICIALPVRAGQSATARAVLHDLDGPRRADYVAAAQRGRIRKACWALQHTAQGDLLVAYLEGPDLRRALRRLARSPHAFDRWLTEQLWEITGVDLRGPAALPARERVCSYEAPAGHVPV